MVAKLIKTHKTFPGLESLLGQKIYQDVLTTRSQNNIKYDLNVNDGIVDQSCEDLPFILIYTGSTLPREYNTICELDQNH